MPANPAEVTLQINLAPTDHRHARHILPHQLGQLGGQVAEILLVVDLSRGRLVSPSAWAEGEAQLRGLFAECAAEHPHLRALDVDHSPALARQVAAEFFGGEPVPDKDWRGAPIYPYFFGLCAAEHNYVLHMDSDMMFGGGSPTWVAEAVELLRSSPDVLVCSPLPGPPTADGRLTSQTLPRAPHPSLAFRADQVSTRLFMLDRSRFATRIGALPVRRPPRRLTWMARLDGFQPHECAETTLSDALVANGLARVDFLGAEPGMWSVHPPYRSELFYDRLPRLIEQIETGDVPAAQRGDHDVNDSMVDWSSARRPRWRRLAGHGELALRNAALALSPNP